MTRLILDATATAAWQRLIHEAGAAGAPTLDEDRESYLVFLLMRYLRRPDMVRAIMAVEFLRGLRQSGRLRRDRLQAVGDQCLIFAGLFPEQAERRRVRLSYFVDLGRTAYSEVAEVDAVGLAELFHSIAEGFVAMADVLRAIRELPEGAATMGPLEAAERALAGDSALARERLAGVTDATLIAPGRRHH